MFNMMNVGRTNSDLRREKNMTQMELAEKLDVSFQAVSGWERGKSMPDVSRLPELAELFGVPIARILGEEAPLVDAAAAGTVDSYLQDHTVTPEELEQAAPILKPEQVDAVLPCVGRLDLKEAQNLLPFLSRETLEKLGEDSWDDPDIGELAPWLGEKAVDRIAARRTAQDLDTEDLIPFMSKAARTETAEACFRQDGLEKAEDFFTFLDEGTLENLAREEFNKNGLQNLECIAPFLREQTLIELLQKRNKS